MFGTRLCDRMFLCCQDTGLGTGGTFSLPEAVQGLLLVGRLRPPLSDSMLTLTVRDSFFTLLFNWLLQRFGIAQTAASICRALLTVLVFPASMAITWEHYFAVGRDFFTARQWLC